MVASGTLSTKQLAKADTQSNSNIETANRDSSLTDRMKSSVFLPIHEIRPRRESAYGIFSKAVKMLSMDSFQSKKIPSRGICIKINRNFCRIFLMLPPWEWTTMRRITGCSIQRAPWGHRNPRCRLISKAAKRRPERSSLKTDLNEANCAGRRAWSRRPARIPISPATTCP